MRRLSRFENVLLSVGAVIGSLCLLAALTAVLFGMKPLMFKSGSMEPSIPTGGLALSVPVDGDDIRVGDVVSTENAAGVRITHRVAIVEPADGYTSLTLKGDANDVVDAEAYAVTEVHRVFWSAPLLGYIVAWSSGPVALFLGGLLTAYLLFLAFGIRTQRDDGDGSDLEASAAGAGRRALRPSRQRSKHTLRRTTGISVAGALLLTGGALYAGGPARAEFSDGALGEAKFGAGTLAKPTVTCATTSGDSGIVLTWPYAVVPQNRTFSVTWRTNPNAGWQTWPGTITVNAAGESRLAILARDLNGGAVNLGGNQSVYFRVQAFSNGWSSPLSEVKNATYTAPVNILFLGLTDPALRCT